MLRHTPFHPRTAAIMEAANWRRWAGYAVASCYEMSHEREYAAVRNAAALFDITPLFKYLVRGRDAARLLDRIVTRDVQKARVGQVLYTPWCDGQGKVMDDGTVTRLEDDLFRLTAAEPNLRWLERNAPGLAVTIEDVSASTAALALQGPRSRDILQQAFEGEVAGLKFFRLARGTVAGAPVMVTRTGYTGDLGYELWMDAADALPVWDALIRAGRPHGITPAGIWALDVARIEAGLIMLDVDYVPAHRAQIEAQKSSPFELNLGWAVSPDKGDHIGRRALAEERRRGPAWGFVGIEVEWDSLERLFADLGLPPRLPSVAWRTSVPLYDGAHQIGYATSGCWSPLLKRSLALAHVQGPYAAPGTPVQIEVTVEHRRRRAAARVARLPFLELERKKG